MAESRARDLYTPPGWGVMKDRRLYFPKTFSNKSDAELALWEMIDIYPKDSHWRTCLYVDWYAGDGALEPSFRPPYGHRYKESRHGTMLIRHDYEQENISIVRSMREHYSTKEIAKKLNELGRRNRKREKFKSDYVQRILDDLPTERIPDAPTDRKRSRHG